MGWQIKVSYFSFHLSAIQLFISPREKGYEYTYRFPPHVSAITGSILITIIRFTHYDLLFASNTTLMIDSQYLGRIQIWRKLNDTAMTSLQIHHVDSRLKRRGSDRFHVVSTWNPRDVFLGLISTKSSR